MPDCKHEQLRADTFIDRPGLPTQKVFTFLRCKACGSIFPISPDRHDNISGALAMIEKSIIFVNQTLNKILDKSK
jgi:hypothetical protein